MRESKAQQKGRGAVIESHAFVFCTSCVKCIFKRSFKREEEQQCVTLFLR